MLVKVSRLTSKKAGDLPFDLTVEGHLVDKDGRLIPGPIVGEPIYLNDKPNAPWKFMTTIVKSVVAGDGHWTVICEAGPYMIFKVNVGAN